MAKRKYPDYQEINEHNFADICRDVSRLVFFWLKKSKSPVKHWESMRRQFMEQVWVQRNKFDRRKGALTTWLGWQWKHYTRDAKRFGKSEGVSHLGDVPLRIPGEREMLIHRMVQTTPWGLSPDIAVFGLDLEDSLSGAEHKPKASAYVEDLLRSDPSAGLMIEDLISRLPADYQHLAELLSIGNTPRQISMVMGISYDVALEHIHALGHRFKAMLSGKVDRARSNRRWYPSGTHWHEYFKTALQTMPTPNNDWSHAQQTRLRNKWKV